MWVRSCRVTLLLKAKGLAQTEHAMSTWLQYFHNRLEAGEWPTVVERYTASMYWALTTMSTIGYGDIKSITNVERIVSIVIMLVGSVIFGVVVGGMTQLIAQLDAVTNRAQERINDQPSPSRSP